MKWNNIKNCLNSKKENFSKLLFLNEYRIKSIVQNEL